MTSKNGENSGGDSDNDVDEDMETLRRACILTGTNLGDLDLSTATPSIALPRENDCGDESESESEEDDLDFRSLQRRFSISDEVEDDEPLSFRPGASDNDSDYNDDFQLLREIERRFSQYNDSANDSTVHSSQKHEQADATNIDSEKESSYNFFVERTHNGEGFPDCVDMIANTQNLDPTGNIGLEKQLSGSNEWHESGREIVVTSTDRNSSFPKSAQAFLDAIKKNRSCQNFINKKLMQIETRIEENKKMINCVKILKGFQVACKKRIARALSRQKDARAQLISVPKLRANAKVDGRKVSAFYHGPAENSQVANHRMALKKFPSRAKWSKEEKENLAKGIKQQYQHMLLEKSGSTFSEAGGVTNEFDSMSVSIRDLDMTSEHIRLFLPKVNWKQLAEMYLVGRTGPECESRWLNCEDPLINHHPWTKLEDKNLLHIVQQMGINNWEDISVAFGKTRTPFQCLARYQRSLNASILKREWSKDEDDKLRAAVAAYGESNWQIVASTMEQRTAAQCSNRWTKSLTPYRQRVGRWSSDEDKRLKIAVMLFGGKNWYKVAQFIPGRTQVQCRERWVNCLDPSLNMGKWTDEEDSRLRAAISKHGYSWSLVAACVAPRTDSQCRRRWAVLLPHEVSELKAARKIQKVAMISNFVDRESERPALGPNDFISPTIESIPESKDLSRPRKRKRKLRPVPEHNENESASGCVPRRRSRRLRKKSLNSSDKVLRLTHGDEAGDGDVSKKKRKRWNDVSKKKKKRRKTCSLNEKHTASPLALSRLETGVAINDDVGVAAADSGPLCEERPLRCLTPDIIDSWNLRSSRSPSHSRREKSKTKDRACSKKKTIAEDEDDMTLASFLQKIGKHRKCALLSSKVSSLQPSADLVECSQNFLLPTSDIGEDESSTAFGACKHPRMPKQVKQRRQSGSCEKSETPNEDDITLASFLQKTGKHRKCALLSSKVSSLEPSSDVVDCSQNFRLPTSDIAEDERSTAFGACKHQRMPKQVKKRRQSGSCEKSETPKDDITLASFIFTSKKRRRLE